MEAYASLALGAYFHDQADGLWISNFLAGTLTWARQGLTLTQETTFPDSGYSRLIFTLAGPRQLSVRVRIPAWAGAGVSLRVNGVEQNVSKAPGQFALLSRVWQSGDVLEITLPFRLYAETIPDRQEYAAIKYGPQLLAACTTPGATFSGTAGRLLSVLRPTGNPCEFTAPLSTGAVTFKPINRVTSETYNAYTIVTQPPQELVQDQVAIADAASESAHGFQSVNSYTGSFSGLAWRDARSNGSISYTLRVHPTKQTFLKCLYWGSDSGNGFWRLFDIVVTNSTGQPQTVATQSLDNEAPNAWYDVIYPLPPPLTSGQTSVTVTFQAKGFQNSPGWVGGLFDHVQTHCYP